MSENPATTFQNSPLSAAQAEDKLKTSIADFFSNKSSKIISFEAGGGKTQCMTEAFHNRLIDDLPPV